MLTAPAAITKWMRGKEDVAAAAELCDEKGRELAEGNNHEGNAQTNRLNWLNPCNRSAYVPMRKILRVPWNRYLVKMPEPDRPACVATL